MRDALHILAGLLILFSFRAGRRVHRPCPAPRPRFDALRSACRWLWILFLGWCVVLWLWLLTL